MKTNPVPLNSKTNYLTNSREIALTGVKGSKPTFHSEYDNGPYNYPICRDKGRFHPTQKPLELCNWFIKKYSDDNNSILDLFGGSGSTLIACEQLNRKCYMMELDPHYIDVIIQRWENFTGEKAIKLN